MFNCLAVIVVGSNISGEIYYPSVKQCAEFKIMGYKIFQDGPNISEIFLPGGPKIIWGSKYFEKFGTGKQKMGGPVFL